MIPVYAIKEIKTYNGKIYAKQGEMLYIFNRNENILFVMDKNENRFTCLADDVSNLKPNSNVAITTKHKGKS